MPQLESTASARPVPPASGAPKPARDARLDVFRGLALVMIYINHFPGNPYEDYTNRNFGFSDAAEAFFMLSGIAAGLAYSGRFQPAQRAQNGLWAAIAPMWSRAWTLYTTQIFLTVWAIAIYTGGALWFDLPKLMTIINLRQLYANTAETLIGIPLLTHQLGYVNILPAYSFLLLLAPVAILIGLKRPWLMLGLSALIWFWTGWFRWNLPNFPNPGGWFFNPLAWQILFVTGLMTGLCKRQGRRFVPYHPVLFWAAVGVLVLILCWMKISPFGIWLNHQLSLLGKMGVPFHMISHDKTFVAFPRMIHILALSYVLAYLAPVDRFCRTKWVAPLAAMGRQGLLVFSTGTMLSLSCLVLFQAAGEPVWLGWTLPLLGISIMITVAFTAERLSTKRRSLVVAQG